ncbi:MAG: O-methyltransferase [Clostridia bacterium]
MDDSVRAFIETLLPEETPSEQELRNYAAKHRVPILRREAAAFLRTIAAACKPARILEIGTAIGYSAVVLSHTLPDSHIDTVEIDPDFVVSARENFVKIGVQDRIRVIAGDGADVLASLYKPYDMIFLDAAKGQYLNLYEDALRLLEPRGVLLCDNCIFYGKVTDPPEQAPHKHRTIVANLRAFLQKMMSDPRLRATLLDVGDGMAVACKIKGEI